MKLKGGGGTLTSDKYLVEGNGPIDGEKRTPNIWYDDTMTLSNDTPKGMVNLQGFVHSFCMRSCVCLCVCTTDSTVQYI